MLSLFNMLSRPFLFLLCVVTEVLIGRTKQDGLNKRMCYLKERKRKMEESSPDFIYVPLWKRRGQIVDKILKDKKKNDREPASQPRLSSEVDYVRGRY